MGYDLHADPELGNARRLSDSGVQPRTSFRVNRKRPIGPDVAAPAPDRGGVEPEASDWNERSE
jgi:hypothetical protein